MALFRGSLLSGPLCVVGCVVGQRLKGRLKGMSERVVQKGCLIEIIMIFVFNSQLSQKFTGLWWMCSDAITKILRLLRRPRNNVTVRRRQQTYQPFQEKSEGSGFGQLVPTPNGSKHLKSASEGFMNILNDTSRLLSI